MFLNTTTGNTRNKHRHAPWLTVALGLGCLYLLTCLTACAIPDDIPYPTVETEITAFEVEGQCDATGEGEAEAVIDKNKRTVHVYVNDLVDIANLKVKRLETTNDAAVVIDSTLCIASETYKVDGYPQESKNTPFQIDATHDVPVLLHTYQTYEWTIRVEQVVKRDIEVEGQVGDAVIDPVTRVAIVYVNSDQDLSQIRVRKFNLGGPHGAVIPNLTEEPSVDFTTSRRYYVKQGWSDLIYMWTVYVYTTTEAVQASANVSTTAKGATVISGTRPNGVVPVVEYRAESESEWTTVPATDVKFPTATSYEVTFTALHSDVKYLCHVKFNGEATPDQTFYFEGEQLENSSFDNWHTETTKSSQELFLPWGAADEPYWDTGNHGATTVGASNSTFVDEDGRRYANLQSKYIVIKFAAGNIFTGKYLETDGTNGVLSFGRPFTSRPEKLQFDFQYKTSPITRTASGGWKDGYGKYISRTLFEGLKGQPDSCNVYIALGDWEPTLYKGTQCPYLVRTRPSEFQVLDKNDPHIIAYAQMTCGRDVDSWTTEQLKLDYRSNRTPKYIIVVAASSKYGDYFTGGETSLMKIDNLRLIY
ncbi:MAG: PCMD domain-containing protein [Bacteroidaceae bacterium]|nr:PCMD domain-containing protein [Bacteroidaceae bacterium]